MSGCKNGFIKLDSPRDVFYPGQEVTGVVVIELDQPQTLSVLYVNFLGQAAVEWKEKESEEYNGVKRYKDVEYVGREEYFNVTQLLAGGNAPLNLPIGSHMYQFKYQIPPGVPSSFSGERGGVSYCVKANLELSGSSVFKKELVRNFEVVAPFDLNQGSPKLKEPIHLEFEEVYSCGGCCSSEPVTIRILVPVSGYCPGQVIPVAVQVENQSSVEIRKLIFQILSREKYHTQRPISEYMPPEQVLTTETRGSIMSGSRKELTVELPLPEVIAPNLENCGIIDVGYFIRTKIKLTGCNDDLEDEAEICLGLVPLNETLVGEYVHPLAQSLPIGPIPVMPEPNLQEDRQAESNQQSSYPFTQNSLGPKVTPLNPNGFPSTENVQNSYVLQVQQRQYCSTDPSQNYNIGFTTTSPPAPGSEFANLFNVFQEPNWSSNFPNNKDLKIHLPMGNVNVNIPSAPPPST